MDLSSTDMFIGRMSKKTIRDQFLEYLGETGITVAEFSRRSGVSYDALNKMKRRESASTSDENAQKIRSFIESGPDEGAFDEPVRVDHIQERPNGSALVPVYDVAASAGLGSLVDQETEVYSLAFPPNYLRKLTSSSPKNLAIISVKGDSMEPVLLDDDIVLLDASKVNLSFDGLFVLRFNDALHVKRVGRSAKRGYITIISDNRDLYPPFEAHITDVEAVGKVLWYGRKV